MLDLLRALDASSTDARLWVVTPNAHVLPGDASASPAQALLWGLGRAAALDIPGTGRPHRLRQRIGPEARAGGLFDEIFPVMTMTRWRIARAGASSVVYSARRRPPHRFSGPRWFVRDHRRARPARSPRRRMARACRRAASDDAGPAACPSAWCGRDSCPAAVSGGRPMSSIASRPSVRT